MARTASGSFEYGIKVLSACSSFRAFSIIVASFMVWAITTETPTSPTASSSTTIAVVSESKLKPPYFSDSVIVRSPSLSASLTISPQYLSSGVPIPSRSTETGLTTSSTNFLTVSSIAFCSSV